MAEHPERDGLSRNTGATYPAPFLRASVSKAASSKRRSTSPCIANAPFRALPAFANLRDLRGFASKFRSGATHSPRPATPNPPPLKYLLAGLGNIGAEYAHTRHNIGFDILDALVARLDGAWTTEKLGQVARVKHKGRTFVCLKPGTYMNRSGKAVHYWLEQEKLTKDSLLVIVDDLALDFGALRLRGKGSPGTHNGLKDIDAVTGGGDYARLRVGIGNDFPTGRQVDFVLGHWTDAEAKGLPEVLAKAADASLAFGAVGLNHAMNQFNG